LDDVGTNDYGFADAVAYVVLRLPRMLFEILPPAALIGALLGLGNLAVHRELIVMRASGVSHLQLLGAVSLAGSVLLVIMILLGESFAPSLGAYAREMRMRALNEDVNEAGQSTWLKSGNRIWSLKRELGEFGFGGVYIFDITDGWRLDRIARADFAEAGDDGEWVLGNYAQTRFLGDAEALHRVSRAELPRRAPLSDGLLVEDGEYGRGAADDRPRAAEGLRRPASRRHRRYAARRADRRCRLLRRDADSREHRAGLR